MNGSDETERRGRLRGLLLGGRDSWRRVLLGGAAGGVALAIVAALIAALAGGGSGSLDGGEPTAVVPGPGPVDGDPDIAEPTLTEGPPSATSTVEPEPTHEATATDVPPEPTVTTPLPEPTPTPESEEPPPEPTAVDDVAP